LVQFITKRQPFTVIQLTLPNDRYELPFYTKFTFLHKI